MPQEKESPFVREIAPGVTSIKLPLKMTADEATKEKLLDESIPRWEGLLNTTREEYRRKALDNYTGMIHGSKTARSLKRTGYEFLKPTKDTQMTEVEAADAVLKSEEFKRLSGTAVSESERQRLERAFLDFGVDTPTFHRQSIEFQLAVKASKYLRSVKKLERDNKLPPGTFDKMKQSFQQPSKDEQGNEMGDTYEDRKERASTIIRTIDDIARNGGKLPQGLINAELEAPTLIHFDALDSDQKEAIASTWKDKEKSQLKFYQMFKRVPLKDLENAVYEATGNKKSVEKGLFGF